ncbi:MAG: DUF1028 domain-containing protein [Thaumarchaeota archaeon]|nr:DUF1028 domain-containing protein [Nitrososphaerota archaeon]
MTYSIVARDQKTGDLGVAVQSHYFSVGSVVTWARSGVGAIATQSMAEISYGPLGLDLMAGGKSAKEALESLLYSDPRADTRQVGIVDSGGMVFAHTGSRCIANAGHVMGDQFSCQANLMSNDSVWSEMEKAFKTNSELELPERLVATLEAGEAAGGDARGKQSSALLVVSSKPYPNYWSGRIMDLRVEDDPDPIPELKRLVQTKRAYEWVEKGDDLLAIGKLEESMQAFEKARELAPENDEIRFWAGVTLLGSRNSERDGREILREIFAKNPRWISVTKSLVEKGYLPKETVLDLL